LNYTRIGPEGPRSIVASRPARRVTLVPTKIRKGVSSPRQVGEDPFWNRSWIGVERDPGQDGMSVAT